MVGIIPQLKKIAPWGFKIKILNIMNEQSYYSIVENDILEDIRVSDKELRIYINISNYSNNKNGYCYLTYSRLCEICRIKKRYFIICINNLCKYGYITKIKKTNRTYLMPTLNKTIALRKYKNLKINLVDYDWLNEK